MDQIDYELLSRLAAGESVLRPADRTDQARDDFQQTVVRLLSLRDRGWITLPDGRLTRSQSGAYLLAGPCSLTDAGRAALEHDRHLGTRPPSQEGKEHH